MTFEPCPLPQTACHTLPAFPAILHALSHLRRADELPRGSRPPGGVLYTCLPSAHPTAASPAACIRAHYYLPAPPPGRSLNVPRAAFGGTTKGGWNAFTTFISGLLRAGTADATLRALPDFPGAITTTHPYPTTFPRTVRPVGPTPVSHILYATARCFGACGFGSTTSLFTRLRHSRMACRFVLPTNAYHRRLLRVLERRRRTLNVSRTYCAQCLRRTAAVRIACRSRRPATTPPRPPTWIILPYAMYFHAIDLLRVLQDYIPTCLAGFRRVVCFIPPTHHGTWTPRINVTLPTVPAQPALFTALSAHNQ